MLDVRHIFFKIFLEEDPKKYISRGEKSIFVDRLKISGFPLPIYNSACMFYCKIT